MIGDESVGACRAPQSLRIVNETGSTNADLMANEAAADGGWLVALRQTQGRGRSGRPWQSVSGNFHGSTLILLRADDPPAHTLALVIGIALFDCVHELAPQLTDLALKWPNDLLAGAAKLAGILLERQGDRVVAGIGVNLAYAPDLPDRPTIALNQIGHGIAPAAFAAALASHVERAVQTWRSAPFDHIIAMWNERGVQRGSAVIIRQGPLAGLTGTFQGLDAEGNLLLGAADGTERTIVAGDVDLVMNKE